MRHDISNWCGSSHIEVDYYQNPDCGPLITVSQRLGSCSFNHQMTPIQAREMATALNDAAAEVEEVKAEINGVPT